MALSQLVAAVVAASVAPITVVLAAGSRGAAGISNFHCLFHSHPLAQQIPTVNVYDATKSKRLPAKSATRR